jgi:hypothetical protein
MLIFLIIIVFVSIIFHLKSILTKNYLISHLLNMIFNFLLNYVLLFSAMRGVINWRTMNSQYAIMSYHLYLLKNNSKIFRKMYYNPLRIINEEISQQTDLPCYLMSRHLSPLKNNSKNYRKCIFIN